MKLSDFFVNEVNVAEKAKNSGRMVAIFVPEKLGEKIQGLFKEIDGDVVEPKDMHITLGLVHEGEDDKIVDVLKQVSKTLKPFNIDISDFDIFDPTEHSDNKFVLHAKPQSKEIFKMHQKVLNALKQNDVKIDNGNFDFTPHITVKYCSQKPNLSKKIKARFPVKHVALAAGDNKKIIKI